VLLQWFSHSNRHPPQYQHTEDIWMLESVADTCVSRINTVNQLCCNQVNGVLKLC
jgi:hypothetical protein